MREWGQARPVWLKYRSGSSCNSLLSLLQAFPPAETKWNRNDQELPPHRVHQIMKEGKHILEIRKPRKVKKKLFFRLLSELKWFSLQSDAGVYTCEAGNSEGEISAVLTIEENENMPEVFEEFLEEVPEMIKDIQESSGAAGSSPVIFLLTSVLATAMRYIAWLRLTVIQSKELARRTIYTFYTFKLILTRLLIKPSQFNTTEHLILINR